MEDDYEFEITDEMKDLQTAPTLEAAYRLADLTMKPVRVPGYPYLVQPDYRPGFTTIEARR